MSRKALFFVRKKIISGIGAKFIHQYIYIYIKIYMYLYLFTEGKQNICMAVKSELDGT